MSAFHKQSFASRFGTMGDTAERIFDEIVGGKAHELGLCRPPFGMQKMTAAMRYTPDRLTGEQFVECMGIGRDGILKIKDEKIEALQLWSTLGPLDLFVYDQARHKYCWEPFVDWRNVIDKCANSATFPEGKTYRALHRDDFPGRFVDV